MPNSCDSKKNPKKWFYKTIHWLYTRVWNVEWVGWCLFVGWLVGWTVHARMIINYEIIFYSSPKNSNWILRNAFTSFIFWMLFASGCVCRLMFEIGFVFVCCFYEHKMHLCGFNQRMRWVRTKKQHIIKRCDDLLKMLMCFFFLISLCIVVAFIVSLDGISIVIQIRFICTWECFDSASFSNTEY